MELSPGILIAILTVILTFVVYLMTRSTKNVPPSLPWLPVVGSLPFLSGIGTLNVCFAEKAKRYGNVYALYAGQTYAVVLNGYDALREALVKRSADFGGRGTVYAERNIWNPESKGIAFRSHSKYYKLLKQTSIAVMKKLGMGERAVMEVKIHEEINMCVKYIHEQNGKAFDPEHILRMGILNIIFSLLFGKRFELDDPTGAYISNGVLAYFDTLQPILDLFPIMRHLPMFGRYLKDAVPRSQKWKEFCTSNIEECLGSSNEETFVKLFVKELGSRLDPSDLYYIVKDFINGGTETSSTTLLWAIILINNHPSVQKRLHDEIDSVVPRDRLPLISDKLPFVEATMLEILRLKTVAPLAAPHITLCDTEVAGFFIPNNTQIIVNLWSAQMDPDVWEKPEQFRPERFLNEKGEVFNRDRIIAFSLGKRTCPGELLARHEVFLFLAALMQEFDILPPEGQTTISDNGKINAIFSPDPFKVRLLKRVPEN